MKERFLGDFVGNFLMRNLKRPLHFPKMILSAEELGSIYHLPNIKYNKAPTINWQNYKVAPPPANIPTEGILLGHNMYRGVKERNSNEK